MSTTRSSPPTLGRCPDCQADIASYDVLIEYETDGQPAVWADCPRCGTTVERDTNACPLCEATEFVRYELPG